MIVWLASYPRSGNTLLRIVLHRSFGIRSSVVYDEDGVATRLGEDFVGYEDRPGMLDEMRRSPMVRFVKTHRQRDADVHEDDAAICLVRDGRDALVSFARQRSEHDPSRYEHELEKLILRDTLTGTGSWGKNVLSWLTSAQPNASVIRFDELIAEPKSTIDSVLANLNIGAGTSVSNPPSFAELNAADPKFFRRGITGTHRDEMPAHLHDLFCAQPGNAEAMQLLGLEREHAGDEANAGS